MAFASEFVKTSDFINLFGIPIDRAANGLPAAVGKAAAGARGATRGVLEQAAQARATGEIDPLLDLLPHSVQFADALIARFEDADNYAFDTVSLLGEDRSNLAARGGLPGAVGLLLSGADDGAMPTVLAGLTRFFFGPLGFFGKRNFNGNEALLLDAQQKLIERRWRRARPQWLQTHDRSLSTYFVELFAGRFRDRNGTQLGFDLKLGDLVRFDRLEISPQVVGQLFYAFIEYMSDAALRVPFYAPEILDTYRQLRVAQNALAGVDKQLEEKKRKISAYPQCSTIGHSNVYEDDQLRRLITGVRQLDERALALEASETDLGDELAMVESVDPDVPEYPADPSDLQTAFACFKANVIKEHLHCIFLNERGCAEADRRRREGGHAGGRPDSPNTPVDYADLVGAVVSFASRSVEKGTRSIVGGLVRGGGPLSLANEVLAELITTSAGCLAKKAVEKFSYELAVEVITDKDVIPDEDVKKKFLNALWRLHLGGQLETA